MPGFTPMQINRQNFVSEITRHLFKQVHEQHIVLDVEPFKA